jgi:lipoprotein-anchoring transpeptidase ErfK/SrfK
MRARRRLVVCGGLLGIGLAVLGAWLATDHSSAPIRATHQTDASPITAATTTAATATTTAAARPHVTAQSTVTSQWHPTQATPTPSASPTISGPPAVAAETLVATISPAGAPASQTPGGPAIAEVPREWLGGASILPVIAQQPGWVEVRLAQRPNESTAWVPASDVSLATDSYHIVIDLATMHLQLFNAGQQMADFPAGIGVPSAPTPSGQFFVALFAEAPSPGYGAFVIVTSAHSNTYSDWEQSGDAITAIHGSLGSDAAIGTTGAQVSHGCIRLHNSDLAELRGVPAGTPIDIVE